MVWYKDGVVTVVHRWCGAKMAGYEDGHWSVFTEHIEVCRVINNTLHKNRIIIFNAGPSIQGHII